MNAGLGRAFGFILAVVTFVWLAGPGCHMKKTRGSVSETDGGASDSGGPADPGFGDNGGFEGGGDDGGGGFDDGGDFEDDTDDNFDDEF